MSRGRRVRCGHGVTSASASGVGSNVRSKSALDALGGVWKRLEPSSLCHVYAETTGPSLHQKALLSNYFLAFSRMKFGTCWCLRPMSLLPQFVETLLKPFHELMLPSRK